MHKKKMVVKKLKTHFTPPMQQSYIKRLALEKTITAPHFDLLNAHLFGGSS